MRHVDVAWTCRGGPEEEEQPSWLSYFSIRYSPLRWFSAYRTIVHDVIDGVADFLALYSLTKCRLTDRGEFVLLP